MSHQALLEEIQTLPTEQLCALEGYITRLKETREASFPQHQQSGIKLGVGKGTARLLPGFDDPMPEFDEYQQ